MKIVAVFSFIPQAYYVCEWADNFAVHGAAPVKTGFGADAETNKLAFCTESEITKEKRRTQRQRTAQLIKYQRSMKMLAWDRESQTITA